MNTRHRTAPRLLTATGALALTLALAGCGGGEDTATSGSGTTMDHGGGHGASSAPDTTAPASPMSNEADVSFLTGMKPHHEQAVEMSDVVLAADPPAAVAELAQQIKAAQGPEIEQMNTMLTDLGQPTDTAAHGHTAGHGGMMSAADMDVLRNATGADAARLYLQGMVEHHKGAIEAARTELEDGTYEPARELATSIAQEQAAEITKMEALLPSL